MTNFSLFVKKTYMTTVGVFTYDRAEENGDSAACTKARAKQNVRAAEKHFSLSEMVVCSAHAADRSPRLAVSGDFSGLRKCTSTRPSRLDPGLALRTPPQKKKGPSHFQKGDNVMTPLFESGIARESEGAESRSGDGGWMRIASSVTTSFAVKPRMPRDKATSTRDLSTK